MGSHKVQQLYLETEFKGGSPLNQSLKISHKGGLLKY